MLAAEAEKYETRGAFGNGNKGAYHIAQKRGILHAICGHMEAKLISWTDEMLAAEAEKYETRGAFAEGNSGAYSTARKRGILNAICGHMEAQSTCWTDEMLGAEAAKYETRKAFKKGNSGAYSTARKRGILDAICGHMEVQRIHWTYEMLAAEAEKYETRKAFEKGNAGAYNTARKRGILDAICEHMVAGYTAGDNDAIYIWRAVGHRHNGKDVYKIGVTSTRLGDQRIQTVANVIDTEADIVILKAVEGRATDVERELHKVGDDPQYVGMDGATEFRAMDEDELAQAVALVTS
jgi:hypothetical protein